MHKFRHEQPSTDFHGRRMKILGGRYAVQNKPSHGGMLGKIYFGRDTVLEREVAIKKVKNPAAGRSEALALAAVAGHDTILKVYDFFEENRHGFIVAERIYGKPLGDDERGRQRREACAVETTMNVLRGLQHIHRRGYLHTDIKPQNVLLPRREGDPPVKIVDFGGAARKGAEGIFRGRCEAGCPLYMPPEQFDEPAALDDSSDLYQAAGLCIYLLTGRPPIDPPDLKEKQAYYTACRKLQERGLCRMIANAELRAVLARALHPCRASRYGEAQELIDALHPFSTNH